MMFIKEHSSQWLLNGADLIYFHKKDSRISSISVSSMAAAIFDGKADSHVLFKLWTCYIGRSELL